MVAPLRIVMGSLERNKLYPPHSKQNENKTHTNPHISLVVPGNFQFFKSSCLHTLLPASVHIRAFSSECNFKLVLQGAISPASVPISEILEPVAAQCLVFISVPCETGHEVNGGVQISDLQTSCRCSRFCVSAGIFDDSKRQTQEG